MTELRKLNATTKPDSFPLPRIKDLIDKIGQAKFVSKFDLKGYYSIPLTPRAKELSAFITLDGLDNYQIMPFNNKSRHCRAEWHQSL